MGPVFLFDMGVILAVIRPASGEFHRLFPLRKMPEEVVIEEFAAIVAIEAEQRERERRFDIFDLFQDSPFSLAPDGSLFCPAGGDIDAIEGKGEHSHHGFAAVGHGIGFEKTGTGFIPLVDLDRDLFSQQCSGLCGGAASFAVLDSGMTHHSVNGGRRDCEQCLAHVLGKLSKLSEIPRQP